MTVEVNVPTLGESVTEATVGKWTKGPGDAVAVDEPLVELETDKVTIEVNAPAAGTLGNIAAAEGATVEVGALLATSLLGHGIAFGLGLVAYGLVLWLLERRVSLLPALGDEEIRIWGVLQRCSTACLWSSWLVQDLADIFVFVPRRLYGLTMAICTLVRSPSMKFRLT